MPRYPASWFEVAKAWFRKPWTESFDRIPFGCGEAGAVAAVAALGSAAGMLAAAAPAGESVVAACAISVWVAGSDAWLDVDSADAACAVSPCAVELSEPVLALGASLPWAAQIGNRLIA